MHKGLPDCWYTDVPNKYIRDALIARLKDMGFDPELYYQKMSYYSDRFYGESCIANMSWDKNRVGIFRVCGDMSGEKIHYSKILDFKPEEQKSPEVLSKLEGSWFVSVPTKDEAKLVCGKLDLLGFKKEFFCEDHHHKYIVSSGEKKYRNSETSQGVEINIHDILQINFDKKEEVLTELPETFKITELPETFKIKVNDKDELKTVCDILDSNGFGKLSWSGVCNFPFYVAYSGNLSPFKYSDYHIDEEFKFALVKEITISQLKSIDESLKKVQVKPSELFEGFKILIHNKEAFDLVCAKLEKIGWRKFEFDDYMDYPLFISDYCFEDKEYSNYEYVESQFLMECKEISINDLLDMKDKWIDIDDFNQEIIARQKDLKLRIVENVSDAFDTAAQLPTNYQALKIFINAVIRNTQIIGE